MLGGGVIVSQLRSGLSVKYGGVFIWAGLYLWLYMCTKNYPLKLSNILSPYMWYPWPNQARHSNSTWCSSAQTLQLAQCWEVIEQSSMINKSLWLIEKVLTINQFHHSSEFSICLSEMHSIWKRPWLPGYSSLHAHPTALNQLGITGNKQQHPLFDLKWFFILENHSSGKWTWRLTLR